MSAKFPRGGAGLFFSSKSIVSESVKLEIEGLLVRDALPTHTNVFC